jgi:shikimate kinase
MAAPSDPPAPPDVPGPQDPRRTVEEVTPAPRTVVGAATSVFLVGPMGSGKTAVGRAVARLLGYGFVDSDAEVESRTGVDIPFIFEKEGEPGFRLREREVIEELTRWRRTVVATGGGAVILEANRRCLAERGVVVYLQASIDQQVERTRHGRHRPLLTQAEDPRARLMHLMQQREPLYREIASVVVPTDGRRVQAVAEDIVAGLRRLGLPSSIPPSLSEL